MNPKLFHGKMDSVPTNKRQSTMPQCDAILTTTGVQCHRVAGDYPDLPNHLHFCFQHHTVHQRRVAQSGEHQAGRCLHYGNRRWCPNEVEGVWSLCDKHHRAALRAHLRALAQEERRQLVQETRQAIFNEFGVNADWRRIVDALALRDDPDDVLFEATLQIYLMDGWRPRIQFTLYWHWIRDGRPGPEPMIEAPPPPPAPALLLLARDPQNVHTQVVSAQTNAAVDKLLAIQVPTEQQTEKTMVRAWLTHGSAGWTDILRTLNDVNKWFNTKTCRSEDDQLYRRLLRGLVATINRADEEMRPELYKRLWEECRESVSMCCEGHISRLCNVMVGFDDAFKPPVALGELIQQKMAAIAGLEVSEEEKKRQATEWFNENNVPDADRTAWLEAF
jgi:hypothetical protein